MRNTIHYFFCEGNPVFRLQKVHSERVFRDPKCGCQYGQFRKHDFICLGQITLPWFFVDIINYKPLLGSRSEPTRTSWNVTRYTGTFHSAY